LFRYAEAQPSFGGDVQHDGFIGLPPSLVDEPLRPDHNLERLALVHRPVTVGHPVKVCDEVEDAARIDPALKNIRQQFLDVSANRRGAAAYGNVVIKRWLCSQHCLALGNANATHCAAWTRDADRSEQRLIGADAFEYRVDAEAAAQPAHMLNRLVAALTHHVGCAKFFGECDAVGMTAQDDDPLSAEPSRRDHAA